MEYEKYMRRALQLAEMGRGKTLSNPMVGAVIVHADKIIGEGYHEFFGGPHAEVNAVRSVKNTALLKNSTLFVTLEPCAHHGKTPPCSDLIVEKGIPEVIIATRDPFSEVNGKGIEKLRNAGIHVVEGILANESRELNKRFFVFHQKKRPYVILKWAQSADGFMDVIRTDGMRKINWITAPGTQVLTHTWRSEESAILCGWKTIANDNPSLTTRVVKGRNPVRIILDPELNSPEDSVVFQDGGETWVLNKKHTSTKGSIKYIQLSDFKTDNILKNLFELSIPSVIVEGGLFTLKAFLDSGKYDEIRVLRGSRRLETGIPAPEFPLSNCRVEKFGSDELIICSGWSS